jgi:dsDNA-specific endonuclease/ATPase MutS2
VFIEPEGVRQLGQQLTAALDKECDELVRILREISAMIAEHSESLRTTLAAMAHVDMT